MNEVEILKAARSLIEDQNCWATGKLARDAAGLGCDVYSDSACQFCALGALERIQLMTHTWRGDGFLYKSAIKLLIDRDVLGWRLSCKASPAYVNDVLGHAAVMEMYDRAIEMAQQELSKDQSSNVEQPV